MLTWGIQDPMFSFDFSRLSLPTWPPPQYPQIVTYFGSQRSNTGQQIWKMMSLTQKTHLSLLQQAPWPQKRRRDGGRSTKETPEERSWPLQFLSPLALLLLLTHLLLLLLLLGKMKRSLRWTWAQKRRLQHMSQGGSMGWCMLLKADLLKRTQFNMYD